MIQLKGMTWDHPRGYDPMVATADQYQKTHPNVCITWEKRSLQAFADYPLENLAQRYDLMVIDHPHMGQAAKENCLVALDQAGYEEPLRQLAEQSLGVSHQSYQYAGHQWALAIDAAAQVAAYRPDLFEETISTWQQVIDLAKTGKVLWPIKPVDAMMSFFTLAANMGKPCPVSDHQFIARDDAAEVFDAMLSLAGHLPKDCLSMNPIQTLDRMACENNFIYCPLLYGYSNYAQAGFAQHLIRFTNIPARGDGSGGGDSGGGPRGSTLGGAGIAVSAKSHAIEVAVDYAYWVASASCQRGIYFESGGQPGNAVAWSDAKVNQVSRDFFQDTRATLDQAYLRPRYDGYMAFQEAGGLIVNACLSGKIKTYQAIDQLEQSYRESR